MKRVLLLLPTTGYRNDDFLAAAAKLGVEVVTAADYCHRLAPAWRLPPRMALHFDRPAQAAETVIASMDRAPDAVLAVDDTGVELAAVLAQRLGLAGNPPEAVRRVRDKLAFRRLLADAGMPCPGFLHLASGEDPRARLAGLRFPAVVKARRLSASRGVIRADDPAQLLRAVARVRRIQARADRDAEALGLVVEDFIPGREFALEGVLAGGVLNTLALFDKPDPLDGPYFEESIYVTPARLAEPWQARIREAVAAACRAAGLSGGPVHAEMRVNEHGVWLLEVAARSIGGLCGRLFTDCLGLGLEELILRHALGEPPAAPAGGGAAAAAVMMIPVPRRGIYDGVVGLADARAVAGVSAVTITANPGQLVAAPPEGASYLGFIFARGAAPDEAECALRAAHRRLHFLIRPEYPGRPAGAPKRR